MRMVLAITVVLVAVLVVSATATKTCDSDKYPRFIKHRTKLREIRGFKPEYISTAIGFGKREDPVEASDLGSREEILLSLLRSFPRRLPAKILLPMIQADPALTKKLMQLSAQNVDQTYDEFFMEPPKTERVHALY